MNTLIVGFDSAWTIRNSGGIVGVFSRDDGCVRELGLPQAANYEQAEAIILQWQKSLSAHRTIIMLDQPTIVNNDQGQRPVENIISSPISLRGGGVQPANTSRSEMFGVNAPVWPFLQMFGGAANPDVFSAKNQVYETYPVLSLIAMGWTLRDSSTDRLPKYNPARRKTFSILDWQHVCSRVSASCHEFGLEGIAGWVERVGRAGTPIKETQDCLDACICLLVGLQFTIHRTCLMVGDLESGYMVIPASLKLQSELEARCRKTGRNPTSWVRPVPGNELASNTAGPRYGTGQESPRDELPFQATVLPEEFNYLRSFRAKGTIDVLKTAPIDFLEEVSSALPNAINVVCQVDEKKLREELMAAGVPAERMAEIFRRIKVEVNFDVRDEGLPPHLRKDLPFVL